MASTTALFTGLSGLSTNARRLDVIGNNIANVNTTAYKANRLLTGPTFSRTFSLGTGPGDATGGSNPMQVGQGATLAGTQRNHVNGSISATGIATDVAIEGNGFFVVDRNGQQAYTRNGAFLRNEANELVTIDGARVQGYGVNDRFELIEGVLVDLTAPIGSMTVAEATRNVTMAGNVNASGDVATTGSIHESQAFYTDAGLTTLLGSTGYDLTVPGNDLYIDDGTGAGTLAIEGGAGTIITVSGVEKGGKDLGEHAFAFSNSAVPGTDAFGPTVQDFMDFLDDVFGLDGSTVGGETLGGGISLASGQIVITGNEGTVQNLDLETSSFAASNNGAGLTEPLVMTSTGDADGESVRTTLEVYDSLGTPLAIDLTMVLQSTTADGGTTWEYVAESDDNDAIDRVIGLGTLEFDANGQFVSASNDTFSVVRQNGAETPLTVAMNFNSPTEAVTALSDTESQLGSVLQDGSPIGTLSSFSIGEDGIISGTFSNGLLRTIGQLAMAKFTNPEGLVDLGNTFFGVGANSGTPLITTPLSFGTGRVVGGALELSNVDLSQEFINMILASTGYSAASRVITTTDELMQQLLATGA